MSNDNRDLFECLVCGEFKRSDNLTRHYQASVFWDDDGHPSAKKLADFLKQISLKGKKRSIADTMKIDHTEYFLKQGYQKIPPLSKHRSKSSLTPSISNFFSGKMPKSSHQQKETANESEQQSTSGTSESETVQDFDEDNFDQTQILNEEFCDQSNSDEVKELNIVSGTLPSTSEKQCFQVSDQSNEEIAKAVVTELKKELKNAEDPFLSELGTKIAEVVSERLKVIQSEKEKDVVSDCWKTGEEFMWCECCLRFSNSDEVPIAFKKFHKNTFGHVKLDQQKFHVRFAMKSHEQNELHKWCYSKNEKHKADQQVKEIENKKAGTLVIRNGLFCLKNSFSSHDFVKLNDKDNLIDEVQCATKNDSKAEFFKIRELANESMTKTIQEVFKSVKSCSVTLDKVTTTHSYQVILTFFFWKGKIHVFLNKIDRLTTEDYDAVGTARKVAQVLRLNS